jgi:hypothetical protein
MSVWTYGSPGWNVCTAPMLIVCPVDPTGGGWSTALDPMREKTSQLLYESHDAESDSSSHRCGLIISDSSEQ